MAPLAGRHEAAEEGEPEHELLQVVGAGGHVEPEGAPEGVRQGQGGRRQERRDQQAVLDPADEPAGERGGRRGQRPLGGGGLAGHFPAGAPRCLRYSSR